MSQDQLLILIIAAAVVGLMAAILILRRQRMDEERTAPIESAFAASTEGETICPNCGMGNLWTDRECIACKARLPDSNPPA